MRPAAVRYVLFNDDLGAFPPPERQRDRPTGNRMGEPSLISIVAIKSLPSP